MKYKILLILTYIFNLFDIYATLYLTATYGIQNEVNPFMKLLLTNNVHWFILYKLIIIGLAVIIINIILMLDIKIAKIITWIMFSLYGLLTVYYIIILNIF